MVNESFVEKMGPGPFFPGIKGVLNAQARSITDGFILDAGVGFNCFLFRFLKEGVVQIQGGISSGSGKANGRARPRNPPLCGGLQ